MTNCRGIFPSLVFMSVLNIYHDKRSYQVNYINFIVSVISICIGFIFIFWSAFILHLKSINKFENSWDKTKKGKRFSLYWLFSTDLRNILMGFAILVFKTEILLILLLVIELTALRLYVIVKDESSKVIYALKLF